MYYKKTYRFRDSIENTYTWNGEYGRKNEGRAKKKKPTPEQIKKQNQINRENKIRRKIKYNFEEDDLWITLKYRAGTRLPAEEIKNDVEKLLRSLRGKWKRRGVELKYIVRIEVGARGGAHVHLLANDLREKNGDIEIKKSWKRLSEGRSINTRRLDMEGATQLAAYIAKEPSEEIEKQLSIFDEEERKMFIRYSCSKNLKEPKPEVKAYRRRTVEKLVKEGPTATEGYYIVKDTMRQGTNPYTGKSYLYYEERRLSGG